MGKKKLAAGILAAAAAGILGVLFASFKEAKVETTVVYKGHVEDFYTEEGVLHVGKKYEITAQVSGAVQEVAVEENDKVKEGDLLFAVDGSDYEYEKYMAECRLSGYEAQLEEARISRLMKTSPGEYLEQIRQELSVRKSQYEAAKTIYEGSRALYGSGDISKAEMEEREASYRQSQAALGQAESRYEESSRVLEELIRDGMEESKIDGQFYESQEKQLAMEIEVQRTAVKQIEAKLEKCRVTAPADGIIRELPVRDLSAVQPGQLVVSMTGLGENTVEADVLTNIVPYLKEGDPVEIVLKLRGKNVSFPGHIREVYDFARQGMSSLGLDEYRVHVVVDVDGDPEWELSGTEGYGVNVKFCLFDQDGCTVIPSDSVYQTEGESYVYRVEKDRARKQKVEVLYQSGSEVVVAEGVDVGEEIVSQADGEGIFDGAKVK